MFYIVWSEVLKNNILTFWFSNRDNSKGSWWGNQITLLISTLLFFIPKLS